MQTLTDSMCGRVTTSAYLAEATEQAATAETALCEATHSSAPPPLCAPAELQSSPVTEECRCGGPTDKSTLASTCRKII